MSVLRFGTLLLAAVIIAVGLYILTSIGSDETDEDSYVGSYRSREMPGGLAPPMVVVLQVQEDGSAVMRSEFSNNEPATTLTGTWTTDGGVLVVTLRSLGGRPLEQPLLVSFLPEGDLLRATGPTSEEMFGSQGLTLYRE